MGYILKGSLRIFLPKKDQEENQKEEKVEEKIDLVEVGEVHAGELVGEIGAILGREASGRVVAGTGGCELLEISKGFLIEEEREGGAGGRKGLQARVLFAMMRLMWERILKQESTQVEQWQKERERERESPRLEKKK